MGHKPFAGHADPELGVARQGHVLVERGGDLDEHAHPGVSSHLGVLTWYWRSRFSISRLRSSLALQSRSGTSRVSSRTEGILASTTKARSSQAADASIHSGEDSIVSPMLNRFCSSSRGEPASPPTPARLPSHGYNRCRWEGMELFQRPCGERMLIALPSSGRISTAHMPGC